MKHETEQRIQEGALALGVSLDGAQASQLAAHLRMLMEANQELNLTRITDTDDAVVLHIIDSLVALPEVMAAPSGELVDIGSGGGYPGIPLAITSGRHTSLLESIQKKARFLTTVIETLDLDAVAVPQRSEEFAAGNRGRSAVVTARAVAELPVLVELAAPLLILGGSLVALKGRPDEVEVERARAVALQLGMRLEAIRETGLPDRPERRTVLTFRKVDETPARIPRRPGMAQKRPLA